MRPALLTLSLIFFLCTFPSIERLIGRSPFVFAATFDATPTFHSIGARYAGSGKTTSLNWQYRAKGEAGWKQAYPMVYDSRNNQHRGSIVHLQPNTEYEIQISADTTIYMSKTWSETFPINKTVTLPETSNQTLTITQSGSPAGYLLYTGPTGKTATIDTPGENTNITVGASYIVIRNLKLTGAKQYAIQLLDGAHDVVIEENDISNWGTITVPSQNWGLRQGAIFAQQGSAPIRKIIIQRNSIHHPRTDSNSWAETRTDIILNNQQHPHGPEAVMFLKTEGNHVIRYNHIYSDENHYYDDALGGGPNNGPGGFPNQDSDIYGNHIERVWDDAIESEGENINNRIWGNYISNSHIAIAVAPVLQGPTYIWRNVSNIIESKQGEYRGGFIKNGNVSSTGPLGGGIFVFHNTILQPANTQGASSGIKNGPTRNMTTRNNIFHINNPNSSVFNAANTTTNDFDYDLYNGILSEAYPGAEPHGIKAVPLYQTQTISAGYFLQSSSPGFDDGVLLPNFNDEMTGAAPDMGAYETGMSPLQFGVNAYSTPVSPTNPVTPSPGTSCNTAQPATLSCFELWRRAFTGEIPGSDGDFNGDGNATLADFELWRRAFTGV